uniref:Uncharacterized protein n=1 Tax=Loa loa TaxID=7209 RepID=A0A1I7W091_LOALO
MPHVQHKGHFLSKSGICEQRSHKGYKTIVTSDFNDRDQWYLETDEKYDVSTLPAVIPGESILKPDNLYHIPRNYTILPTYYYPTSHPGASNYPVRPQDVSYRDGGETKACESLIIGIRQERHQLDANSRHDSHNNMTGNNYNVAEEWKKNSNISNASYSMLGFVKGISEDHPNNCSDGSDAEHSSLMQTKPQIDVRKESHLYCQSEPEIENKQQTGHQKFRDASSNEICDENLKYRFCQLQKSIPSKEFPSDMNDEKLIRETGIGGRRRSISLIKSSKAYFQPIEHLQNDSQKQERLKLDSKLLEEVESNDNKIGVIRELFQESSNGKKNTENNCHRQQLLHQYPAQQRRKKEEEFINSLVVQRRSYTVPLSPFALSSLMEKQFEIPDDSGGQMNGHEVVLSTDVIPISEENIRQSNLKIG